VKLLGLLLLPAGWVIVLAAVVLLRTTPERGAFVIAGTGVEILGLILLFRAHRLPGGASR